MLLKIFPLFIWCIYVTKKINLFLSSYIFKYAVVSEPSLTTEYSKINSMIIVAQYMMRK